MHCLFKKKFLVAQQPKQKVYDYKISLWDSRGLFVCKVGVSSLVLPAQWAAPGGGVSGSSGWDPVSSSSDVSRMSSKLLLLLLLLAGHCHSWFWFPDDPDDDDHAPTTPTTPPTPVPTTTAAATTSGTLLLSMGTNGSKVAWKDEEASGGGGAGEAGGVDLLATNATDDTGQFGGRRGGGGSRSGSRSADDLGGSDHSKTVRGIPDYLLLLPDWPLCSGAGGRRASFALPNFLNQSSLGEVGAELQEWPWLARSSYHPAAQWFLCLLQAPAAPLPVCPSCRRANT